MPRIHTERFHFRVRNGGLKLQRNLVLIGASQCFKFGAKIVFGIGLFHNSSLSFQFDLDVIEQAGVTRVGDCFGPQRRNRPSGEHVVFAVLARIPCTDYGPIAWFFGRGFRIMVPQSQV